MKGVGFSFAKLGETKSLTLDINRHNSKVHNVKRLSLFSVHAQVIKILILSLYSLVILI